jgi:POT family proton-dependent oligopeptide transporter
MLTPIVTTFWAWQSRNREEPSAILKMAIGCFFLAMGFLIMVPAAWLYEEDGSRVGMSWLISFYLIATLGELYLAPVGLSLVTKLSPKRVVSMMMGIWFLSFFAGNYAAGFLGQYWDELVKENFFIMIATIAFTAGMAMLLILKFLKRVMGRECVFSNPIDLQQ